MSPTIKQLAKTKRPRERLLATGAANLTQAELLAVILGSGTRQKNVLLLAKQVLAQLPTNLAQIKPSQLTRFHGIGPAQTSKIIAALELGRRVFAQQSKPRLLQAADVVRQVNEIRTSHREQLIGLYLNARYELLLKEVLAVGTVNTHQVEARDVFAPAIKLPCRSVILAHNHPSGNPRPSQEDLAATSRLKKAGQLLGISLLDHLIVTTHNFVSLQQEKLL